MGRTALIPFSVRVSVPGDLKILIGSKAPNHSATPSNSHSTERLPLRSRFVKTWKISDIVASTPRNTLSKPQNPWTLISFAQIIIYDVGMSRSIACDLNRTRKSQTQSFFKWLYCPATKKLVRVLFYTGTSAQSCKEGSVKHDHLGQRRTCRGGKWSAPCRVRREWNGMLPGERWVDVTVHLQCEKTPLFPWPLLSFDL